MKREHTKMRLEERNGLMVECAAMSKALDEWTEDSPRVPLVMRGAAGQWYWRGLRAVWKMYNGGDRVTLDGKQCIAQRRTFATDKRGEVVLWFVDLAEGGAPAGKFRAPFPLATKEDAAVYSKMKVDGLHTPLECARILGWNGHGAADAAEKFRNVVYACASGRPEIYPQRFAAIADLVVIPGETAAAPPEKETWSESVAKLRAELVEMRAEVARLRDLVI